MESQKIKLQKRNESRIAAIREARELKINERRNKIEKDRIDKIEKDKKEQAHANLKSLRGQKGNKGRFYAVETTLICE